jgi:hypothetical protein
MDRHMGYTGILCSWENFKLQTTVGETGAMWDIFFLYAAIYIKIKILKKLK